MARDIVAKYGPPKHHGLDTFKAEVVRSAETVVYGTRIGAAVLFLGFMVWMFFVANTFAWVLTFIIGGGLGLLGLVVGIRKLFKAYKHGAWVMNHARDYGVVDE